MITKSNTGHGHVVPRADGVKMRCGGLALCATCQMEKQTLEKSLNPTPPAAQVQGEQPTVVGVRISSDGFGSYIADSAMGIGAPYPGDMREPLMTVAQHERIVAALELKLCTSDYAYDSSMDEIRRLVRELDVLLNGEAGAAKQARLCDLVGQVASVVRAKGAPLLSPARVEDERDACERWIRQQIGMPARIPMDWDGPFNRYTWAAWSARAALSAPPAAGVPEGWKLVPIKPTAEMKAACRVAGKTQVWADMIAASPAAPTPPASEQQTAAARDVLAERRRQVEKEGWTPEHDEEHDAGVLAAGAAAYALNAVDQLHPLSQGANAHKQPACWPWAHAYWKPGVPRRDLVKAGALILAEIERWDRTISHPAAVNQGVTTEAGNGEVGDAGE